MIAVNPNERTATYDGKPLRLLPIEFKIASAFAKRPDVYHYMENFAEDIWGYSDRLTLFNLKVRVHQLSRKFGRKLGEHETGAISVMRGYGYCALSSLVDQTRPWPEDDRVSSAADGRVLVNLDGFSAVCDGTLMRRLTRAGSEVLHMLAEQPGRPVSTSDLCTELWGKYNESTQGRLHQTVYALRQGFLAFGNELADSQSGVIQYDHSEGYRLSTTLGPA